MLTSRTFKGALPTKVRLSSWRGALHCHLRSLLGLGPITRECRGYYRATKYGSFVVGNVSPP